MLPAPQGSVTRRTARGVHLATACGLRPLQARRACRTSGPAQSRDPAELFRPPVVPAPMQPLPPGPSSPTLSLVRMMRDAYGLTARLAKQYGDPFTVRLPMQGPIVVTGDPAAIRGIFAADPETFASAGESMAPIIGRNSMVVLEGAAHRRARKLLTPPFHGSRMRAYGELMRERTQHRTSALSVGAPFEVQALAGSISLDVILQAIFGVREPAPMARLDQAVRGLMGAITPSIAAFAFLRRSFGGVGPWARFVRARGALMAIVSDELAARREDAAERDDILSLMLAARYDDGAAMSDEEIFDQLVTLVAAGHETSTITLAWACYWLHRNPAVLERLVAELDTLGAEPAPDALARLPFLEAVLNETRRHQPRALPGRSVPRARAVRPRAVPRAHVRGLGVLPVRRWRAALPRRCLRDVRGEDRPGHAARRAAPPPRRRRPRAARDGRGRGRPGARGQDGARRATPGGLRLLRRTDRFV
jgi:cytochrome P450 family 110